MKGVTRGIILVLLTVFAIIKAETLAEESVAPHENTLIGINNAEVVAENPVEDDREDERIPTQEDKGITLRTWPFQDNVLLDNFSHLQALQFTSAVLSTWSSILISGVLLVTRRFFYSLDWTFKEKEYCFL